MPRIKLTTKTIGRPTRFTEALGDEICKLIAEGQTLLRICRRDDMPGRCTIHEWIQKGNATKDGEYLYPELKLFVDKYIIARDLQADVWVEETFDIADDGENDYSVDEEGNRVVNYDHIKRSQLRVNVRQWNAARRAPKKYGDRSAMEVSGPDNTPLQTVIYIPDNGRD